MADVFIIVGTIYCILGIIFAGVDISNREVYTPKYFYHCKGYNWFGSWFVFILKTIVAFPFYIIITLGVIIYRFIKWLLTVGRKDNE